MAKRARQSGGSVTGGTGDIKPQILTLSSGVATLVSDYVVRQNSLPVPRFGSSKTKATIMEILSVDWYLNLEDIQDATHTNFGYLTTNTQRTNQETVTTTTMREDAENSRTFAMAVIHRGFVTSGMSIIAFPISIDMTDSNGNGLLIATDQLFVVGGNINGTVGGSYIAKIKYRLVMVGITEYVGIVQSQQAG